MRALQRQSYGKGGTLTGLGLYRNRSAAQLNHPFGKRQPQTVALALAGCVRLIKLIEYVTQFGFVHTDAAVADFAYRTIVDGFKRHSDTAPVGSKLHRI